MNVNYESDLTEEEEEIEKQLHAPEVGSNANKASATLKVGNH